jgi:hypothetical protein
MTEAFCRIRNALIASGTSESANAWHQYDEQAGHIHFFYQ